ncbi:glutamate 5-kinase [Asticcacaulis machinosus]|uniref:Glutamate 5-kinase n=1 Tax=Asticcacaulis machinosus TaxID=2984211 RepID=A0ABT5HLH5_9CAUL|nr:glutamate 5-kinase [Asticcacaulis machinosus]MDC7676990.1 glutamate 5-kinase [Asticcacaulis machinosus]
MAAKTEVLTLPEPLLKARRLTVKIGSALVVNAETGEADIDWMRGMAQDVAALMREGKQVMIVSSGAGALGRRYLGLKGSRLRLDQKQAAAAVGQPRLMQAWEGVFNELGLKTAQVLLTREDTEKRRRWLNARATIETLFDLGCVPIVNENDTVVTEEIRYGDNDRLAARAAQLVQSEALILLSDIDGLYTADPRKNPDARHIPLVERLDSEIEAMAGGANASAGVGTGGMATKIAAARIAGSAGCSTTIAYGAMLRPLLALGAGAKFTLIRAQASVTAAYKAWIAGTVVPAGEVVLDDGAVAALKSGKSLLPSGIVEVHGSFDKGDSISILGMDRAEHARGIVAYGADEIRLIKGRPSKEIEGLLGYTSGDAVIHRDNLAMI